MPRTKQPDTPISPAVAAAQADWHVKQAVACFIESETANKTHSRAVARVGFLENIRLALPSLGVEPTIEKFTTQARGCLLASVYAAIDVIRELAREPLPADTRLAAVGQLIEAAVKLAGGK